jgi:hypothetical protein
LGNLQITQDPVSRTNNAGTLATFQITATGNSPTYQWQKDENNIYDNSTAYGGLYGTLTATLLVSNCLAADEGGYRCIVSDNTGSKTSLVATLTVVDPAINAQPASQTVVAGDTANFFVGADGTVLVTYQWRLYDTNLPGEIYSSLNVGNAQSGNQGPYTVVVGSGTGGSITSAVANLALLPTPANRLARWDFNDTNSFPATAPLPSTGSGTASLIGSVNANFTGGTYADPAGPPGIANNSWSTSGYPPQGTANKTAGVRFNVSTVGQQDILLTWEERHSAAASKYMRLQYSTDGVNFTDGELITMLTDGEFDFFSSDLSGIPGVNDNANFAFRIVAEWESTAIGNNNANYVATTSSYFTSGVVRFDLVTVFGNTLGSVSPIPLAIQRYGNNVVLSWNNPVFALQAAPAVTGTFTNVPGASSPYTNALSDRTKFFRLKH